MPTVAVIGAGSMVGSRFCEQAKDDFNLVKSDLNGETPVDITETQSVENLFKNFDFNCLILFSAFTDVDRAQEQENNKEGSCWKINVRGTKNVAQMCRKYSRKMVLFSTDFIFDGTGGPYSEDSIAGPDLEKVSWYGITKMESEKIVSTLPQSLIIRITYPYRANFPQKEDFARSIIEKAKDGTLYPMFTDQIVTPTFADDLAPAIKLLIEKNQNGIFHVASPNPTNPFDFSKYLLKTFGINTEVQKGSLAGFLKKEGSTPRPLKGGLKTEKIEKLGFTPTSWQKGIEQIHKQLSLN